MKYPTKEKCFDLISEAGFEELSAREIDVGILQASKNGKKKAEHGALLGTSEYG